VRLRDDVRTRESLLVIGLVLTVLAVPIQLKLYAVALAWAAQGVLFVYLGVRSTVCCCACRVQEF
jgi:hypothetical protein